MKKGLLAAAMALTTAVGFAQVDQVLFTDVLDTVSTRSANTFSATYVPVADRYLSGQATKIETFDGTGNYAGDLNISGITPGANGFFGLVATDQGAIYAYEDGGDDIWRWSSVTDTPTKVYDTSPFQRGGDAITIGTDLMIAFTGSATLGNVDFFSDSFPFASGSFTFNESVDLDSKTHLALGDLGNTIFTIGDTGGPLSKFIKSGGVWVAAPGWPTGILVAGPVAYDDVNNIVFVFDMRSAGQKIVAFDASTGAIIGEDPVTNPSFTTAGYAGSHIVPTAAAGTIWMAMRGPNAQINMYEWTYVKTTTSVDNWSLY